jgi:hypothetical protein
MSNKESALQFAEPILFEGRRIVYNDFPFLPNSDVHDSLHVFGNTPRSERRISVVDNSISYTDFERKIDVADLNGAFEEKLRIMHEYISSIAPTLLDLHNGIAGTRGTGIGLTLAMYKDTIVARMYSSNVMMDSGSIQTTMQITKTGVPICGGKILAPRFTDLSETTKYFLEPDFRTSHGPTPVYKFRK